VTPLRALIVGAGPGLGLSVAAAFDRAGHDTILAARDTARLQNAAAGLTYATAAPFDAGALGKMAAALRPLGQIDVLIWNASVMRSGYVADLDPARLEQEWRVNVAGAVQATRLLLPGMVARGRGAILFTGGGLASDPWPQWASLAMGKAALKNFALGLYKEAAPQGIAISNIEIRGIIAPGGPFDPDLIAAEYLRLATAHRGPEDVDIVWAPKGSASDYNRSTR